VNGIRVAVVGAGIAGLSVAAFLARTGTACTLYERRPGPGEVGAGIQLSPNGTRLLHRIGLASHLARTAVRADAVEVRDGHTGAVLARTDLTGFGAPYYTTHRATLHSGLSTVVGDVVRYDRRCVGVRGYPDRVELRFADGGAVSADLLVGADGLYSLVRKAISPDEVRFSGLVAYRALVRGDRPPAVTVWLGADAHVVCYPVGAGRVNVVAVVPDGQPASFPGWHRDVRALIAQAGTPTRWPLHDRAPLDRWYTGRIVLAGDAAHPMLPFAAQGANQAIEDAAVLAACLRDGPDGLQRYQRIRAPRIDAVRALVQGNLSRPDGPRGWLYDYDAEREGEPDADPADPPVPDADADRAAGERTVLATGPHPGGAADP
jgi:salicylate hydroxylase